MDNCHILKNVLTDASFPKKPCILIHQPGIAKIYATIKAHSKITIQATLPSNILWNNYMYLFNILFFKPPR